MVMTSNKNRSRSLHLTGTEQHKEIISSQMDALPSTSGAFRIFTLRGAVGLGDESPPVESIAEITQKMKPFYIIDA